MVRLDNALDWVAIHLGHVMEIVSLINTSEILGSGLAGKETRPHKCRRSVVPQ